MKAFTCTKFTGHYPVGVAAVVIAEDQEDAADMLNSKLISYHLVGDAKPEDMIQFPANEMESVRVLCDGEY